MILRVAWMILLSMLGGFSMAQEPAPVRFETVTLCVDSGSEPLAAWQMEVIPINAEVEVVGIEGVAEPFKAPAYFDPDAGRQGRVLVASFTTSTVLHSGAQSVAILHLRKTGAGQEYDIRMQAAGNGDGERISAKAWWSQGDCSLRRTM